MSETETVYAPDTTGEAWHHWRCRECGKEMWIVSNGEAWVDGKVILPGRGNEPVRVMCPHCGAWNDWRQYN